MKLSKHFWSHEIACSCGCGFEVMHSETLAIADAVREYYGKPITPSSGCRCYHHNKKVGGGEHSQHMYGRGIDLPVEDPKAIYDWLCKRYPENYGFGYYNTFVHVDSKYGPPRRWSVE